MGKADSKAGSRHILSEIKDDPITARKAVEEEGLVAFVGRVPETRPS